MLSVAHCDPKLYNVYATRNDSHVCFQILNRESTDSFMHNCSIFFIQAKQLNDGMVFCLALLSDDEYEYLLSIFEYHENCELKDQVLSRTQRLTARNSKIDCKGSNFKGLRGLTKCERMPLMEKVSKKEYSFAEMAEQCRYIKRMNAIKTNLIKYLDLDNWNEAEEEYPSFAIKERLEPFLGLTFKPGKLPPSFVEFCQLAKRSSLTEASNDATQMTFKDNCSVLATGKIIGISINDNVLNISTKDLLDTIHGTGVGCTGLHLTVINPPEVHMYVILILRMIMLIIGMHEYNRISTHHETMQLAKSFVYANCILII